MTRSVGFLSSLLNSPSPEVSVCARLCVRDVRTSLGSNIRYLRDMTGLDPWIAEKRSIMGRLHNEEQEVVPVQDEWRIGYLKELLTQRLEAKYGCEEDREQYLSELIHSLVK